VQRTSEAALRSRRYEYLGWSSSAMYANRKKARHAALSFTMNPARTPVVGDLTASPAVVTPMPSKRCVYVVTVHSLTSSTVRVLALPETWPASWLRGCWSWLISREASCMLAGYIGVAPETWLVVSRRGAVLPLAFGCSSRQGCKAGQSTVVET
jgi:hypothetical protein